MLSLAIAALGVPSSGRTGLGVQALNRSFLAARCPARPHATLPPLPRRVFPSRLPTSD